MTFLVNIRFRIAVYSNKNVLDADMSNRSKSVLQIMQRTNTYGPPRVPCSLSQ